MRKLLVFVFIFIGVMANAQTLRQFEGTASIYFSSGSGPTYSIRAFYNDQLSYYSSDSAQVGDILYVLNGGACARLRVSVVRSKTGGILDIDVFDIDGVMSAPPSGVGGITRETNVKGLPMYMIGISQSLRTCVGSHLAIKSDTLDTSLAIIDSTVIRNDSVFLAVSPSEFYVGPASSSSVGVDSIQYVRDTTSLSPQTGDQFVNSTKDTSGVYASDRWLLSIGGSSSGGGLSTVEGALPPYGLITPTGRGEVYVDTILGDTYSANGLTNNSWEKVGKYVEVDSLSQILTGYYLDGTIIRNKALNGHTSSYLKVQNSAVSGYTTDTIMVHPTINSKFAVIQPEFGKINVGWFCSGNDLLDDTKYFRAVGSFLRYSKASTLFVPKGDWYINENLSNYNPAINVYGNLMGESRDSSVIKVDSITGLQTSINTILFLVGDNNKASGLGFDIIGDSSYDQDSSLTVLGVDGFRSTIEDNHFRQMTLNTGNTAGNNYLSSSSTQTTNRETYTVIDTIFPGEDIGVVLSSVEGLPRNGSIIFYDATTGNSDTTYINNRYIESDSINVHRITDTIPAGAIAKTMTFGVKELIVQNNIFENIYHGTACKLVSQGVTVSNNKFRNNGDIGNRHDLYNQSGLQTITNNWFEGGGGYAIADANKQNYRISGARVITGNTFFNKPLGIQLTTTTNPISWGSGSLATAIFGNRVMAEGEIITNNIFYNTPGTGSTVSLQVGGAFGGIDPASPLKGNGSVIYSNNTHTGHVSVNAASEVLDMQFTGNLFEINDTSLVDNIDIVFPDSANIKNNTFISRVEANYVFTGTAANVIDNEFKFSKLTSTPYIKFIQPVFERNRIDVDSFKNSFNTVNQLIFINGGTVKSNTFTVNNDYGKKIGGYASGGLILPRFIDNTFNGFCGIEIAGYHNNEEIGGAIFENNEGMLIWSDDYGAAPNAVAQTRNSGRLSNYLSKTLLSGKAGELIKIGTDSTFISATYLDSPDGTLVTPPRSDSTLLLIDATIGRTIRGFVTNATNKNDILVIDTTYAGKLKSQGQDVESNALFVARSLEEVTVWSSIVAYEVGDIVTLSQKCYRAIRPNTNQNPSVSGEWQTYAIEIDVLRNGGIDQSLVTGLTNPLGGSDELQATLDSLELNKHIVSNFSVTNGDLIAASMGDAFTYSGHVNIYSRVNSSSTSDNTINIPPPSLVLLNTRATVFSDDLDNSPTDSYDTKISTTNLYLGNNNITDYTLAGGETVDLLCVERDGGTYAWVIMPAWNGWTSISSFSNTNQTILTERKTTYRFQNGAGNHTSDTLDVSDLEPGDELRIQIYNTGIMDGTKSLKLSSGTFTWAGQSSLDSIYFDGGNQYLDLVWSGTIMYVYGDRNEAGYSGYAEYVDTLGRGGATRVAIAGGDTIHLPNLSHLVFDSQIPSDIDSMYTSTDSLITGRDGDGLAISIEFDVRAATASTTSFEMWMDIGGDIRPLYGRRTGLTKGNGVIQSWSFSYVGRTGDTWEANGGRVMITCDQDIEITNDIVFMLTRTHKAR